MYTAYMHNVTVPQLSKSHNVNYSGTSAIPILCFYPISGVIIFTVKKTTGIVLVSSSN